MHSKSREEFFNKFDYFGTFQILQYTLIFIPLVMVSMSVVNYVFVAEEVDYRCRVPECDHGIYSVDTPVWWPSTNENRKCLKPVLNLKHLKNSSFSTICSNLSFLDKWEECTEWVYENENTIVAGLNLGCRSWIASLVGSSHNAGMIASMILAGWVADRLGRKPSVIICSVGGFVGIVKIFLTNHYAYLVVEFIESFLSSGMYTVAVVLLIEVGGDNKRVFAGVFFSYAAYFGEFIYAFAAMGLQYWKYLILVAHAPSIIFIFYGLVLKESTRWLMIRGKMDDAKENLKAIAKLNKLDISSQDIENIENEELRLIFNVQEQKERESIREIVQSNEIMSRLFVACVCFFTSALIYCGLLVHTVYLPGNKYTNFALGAITCFPGDFLAFYAFQKFGRRITLQFGYFFTAIFIVVQEITPESLSWLKVAFFLCGKFSVVVTYTGIFTYSMELFPTSVRGTLVGCGSTTARIGSMISPLTPLLASQMEYLPSILFSSTSILAAALLFFTPETKYMPMFDTVAQVEAYNSKTITAL